MKWSIIKKRVYNLNKIIADYKRTHILKKKEIFLKLLIINVRNANIYIYEMVSIFN